MADIGHELTDELLEELEKRVKEEYEKALADAEKKLAAWLKKFKAEDEEKKKLLASGQITAKDYKDWRFRHIMMGKEWEKMRDTLAEDFHNANQIALGIARGEMADVYALNMNYGTYDIEHGGKIDTGFQLYNHDTAEMLMREENIQLMPEPSTRKAAQIAANKDLQWNYRHIQSAVLQGVLQGESPYEVAKRLQTVAQMNYNNAVRYARTMTTAAQNAGRYRSYRRARDLGVDLTIEWQATLDGRTRHEHRMMHGQRRKVDEPFNTPDGFSIMWPADCTSSSSDAPQGAIWNCRCTLLAWVKGFEHDTVKSSPKMGDMSFEEWQHAKEPKLKVGSRQRREKEKRIAALGDFVPKPTEDAAVISWVKPIAGEHTRAQDLAAVNPNFDENGPWEWKNNCQRCVTTYEARRRGYDVTALPCYSRDDIYARGTGFKLAFEAGERKVNTLWFENGLTLTESKGFTQDQCLETIQRLMNGYGNGSRCVISGFWEGSGDGHVFIAENVGGKVLFFDPQNKKMDCLGYIYGMGPRSMSIFRIDDLPFSANIKDVFRNDIAN